MRPTCFGQHPLFGVLVFCMAEMCAAVFLAMDEQARVENKTPLVNENLKKCLNTQDGKPGLIIDFLQVFHVDFTLAVFQPEINSLNGLDSCEQVSRDLGITETDMNRTTPLLLELVKRGRHREKGEEASHSDTSLNFVSLKGKGQGHVVSRHSEASGDNGNAPVASLKKGLEGGGEPRRGDSFFDDPLPKPQNLRSVPLTKSNSGASLMSSL
uniref:FGFR1 oncogene partner (FOP) N-terminal dimerisation domain-containing protein n=1 Tax=Oncorhynchus tshawytscha TaxID=74940 RepID=A0A8C8D0G0_ONCTS